MPSPKPSPARTFKQKRIKGRRDAAKAAAAAAKRRKGDARKGEHPLKADSASSKMKLTSKPGSQEGRIKVVSKPRRRRKIGPI